MAINLNTLKTELQSDPNGYGYLVSPLNANVGEKNAALLNEIRNGINIDRTVIPAWEVIDAIVPTEWTLMSPTEQSRISLIISAGDINVRSTNTRSAFLSAFGPGTTTRSNLAALQTRIGSRAEQLFDQAVTFRDVLNALSS